MVGPYRDRHLCEDGNDKRMKDRYPFSLLATVELLSGVRIDGSYAIWKRTTTGGLVNLVTRQHRGKGLTDFS